MRINWKKLFSLILMMLSGSVYADRTITSVTVDGETSTSVGAGESVDVVLNVTTTGSGSNDDWESSSWTLNGVTSCANHGDHTSDGDYSENFSINAPAADGSYDLTLVAYKDDNCNSGASSSYLLSSAIIVGSTGRVVDWVTVDGGASTAVSAGGVVSVRLQVTTSGDRDNNDWQSTAWTVDGSTTCVNHDDHTRGGTYTETFNINAPTSDGTYDLNVTAYLNDTCDSGASEPAVLSNAITVSSSGNPANCGDYTTMAGYGVIGETSFLSGNNSTINSNNISGSGNTPTPSGSKQQINVDFPALDPSTFPSVGNSDVKRKNDFSLDAGSYDDVELDQSNGNLTMTGGNYYISKVKLKKQGSTLYLAPGNYFFEKLELDSQNRIILTGSGAVRIYIKDEFKAGNELQVNVAGSVADLVFYLYDGAKIDIGNGDNGHSAADFKGLIYTPYANTTIEFGNSNDIEAGIFSAGTVDVGNNTDFTYSSSTQSQVLSGLGCSADDEGCVTFRDEFSTTSYSRNDGTANWTGNWQETGDNNSSDNGDIEISAGVLQLEGDGSASNSLGGPYISRVADLTDYSSATLTFRYSEDGNWESDDRIYVKISIDNGSSWSTLHTFSNDQGSNWQDFSLDISSYAGNIVTLAFVEDANKSDEIFYIDDVQIESCGSGNPPVGATADSFSCRHGSDGRLYTRLVDEPFDLQVVALDVDGDIEADFAADADRQVTVELVDMSGGGSCAGYPVVSGAATLTPTFSAADNGQLTTADFTVDKAYATVGCRVTDSNDSPSVTGCSVDTFAIRSAALSLSTTTYSSASSTGTVLARAGDDFTLTVSGGDGYSGTPTIDSMNIEAHAGGVSGMLSGSFVNTDAVAGTAEGASFTYSEVGFFRFKKDGLVDATFASSDIVAGDCVADSTSTTLDADGKLGCIVGSAQTDWIGRFIPYDFVVSNQTEGVLGNSCAAGGFSYAGQSIGYVTNPLLLIKAVNKAGAVTENYAGSYVSLSESSVTISGLTSDLNTNGLDNSTKLALGYSLGTKTLTPLGGADIGQFTLELDGYDYVYSVGGNNLSSPFTPALNLPVTITDNSGTVSDTSDDVTVSTSLSIDASLVDMRYGRIYAENAIGNETSDLTLSLQMQYFDSGSWVDNLQDSCTSLTAGLISIADPNGLDSLGAADTCVLFGSSCSNSGDNLTASSGEISFDLQAPGAGKTGTLNLTIDVPVYLEFDWSGSGATDPTATVTFGSAAREQSLIFMRDVR